MNIRSIVDEDSGLHQIILSCNTSDNGTFIANCTNNGEWSPDPSTWDCPESGSGSGTESGPGTEPGTGSGTESGPGTESGTVSDGSNVRTNVDSETGIVALDVYRYDCTCGSIFNLSKSAIIASLTMSSVTAVIVIFCIAIAVTVLIMRKGNRSNNYTWLHTAQP